MIFFYAKNFLMMLFGISCTFLANSQGILNPQPIGKFLNGNLPATTPNGNFGSPVAPSLLSQTGAFANLNNLTPSNGLIPYDMIEPFWSDGAKKMRWMAIPNNGSHNTAAEQIIFSSTEPWVFPAGAVLIKHFELGGKKLETRFEVLGDDGAYYYLTYKWNTNQTDADLLMQSVIEQVNVNGQNQSWHYLSADKCVDCHTPFSGNVLGPKTRQLNKNLFYPNTGIFANQLVTLSHLGILTENITDANADSYIFLAAKDDTDFSLEYRARSYIDANCSSCHQPGSNNIGQFDARFTTPLENQNIINGSITYDEGVPNAEVVTPMDISTSMMHFRMNSLATGVAMPPLAKAVIDTVGVQLIKNWINSIQPSINNRPTAQAEANSSYGFVPMSVQFNASNSTDPNNNTLSYQWNFGDGTTGSGENVSHTFNTADEYTVTLTVSNGIESDTDEIMITANNGNPGSNIVSFADRTSLLGSANTSGVSMGVVDMNGDGKDDIVRFDKTNFLNIHYQKNLNETFEAYNHGIVSADAQWSMCVGDFDHNGYNDIMSGGAYDDLKIYINNNGFNNYGQFTLPRSYIFLQGANFVDIDNDGWLDIFACHDDAEAKAYRNNTNGTFSFDADLISTKTVPVSDNSGNYASMWTDYDNDGDIDLYISKCRGGVNSPSDPRRINMLWQNDGNNNYKEVAEQANLKIGAQSWLSDFADIDNDGDLDALIINHYEYSQLMRNNGNGTFTDISARSGDLIISLSPNNYKGLQAFFRDFNNDGFVDIIATGTRHFLFYNNGDGTFTKAPNPFNSNEIHSAAVGDLNQDGFVDIYAGYAKNFNTPTNIPDKLWINQGNTNNFIAINLKGTESNINGIGARIEVHGSWGKQIREVRSGEGYGAMNSLTKYVGIGSSNTISKVVVRWTSGIVNQVLNPAPNQFLTIEEGGVCSGPNAPDQDNDGVCDAEDQCPGYNDLLDSDNDGIPNDCDNDCDCISQSETTITFKIQAGTDDAEESATGTMNLTSGDLDMVYDVDDLANAIKIGLRYQNINIPKGANIISANLQFQADEVASVAASFNIFIEDNVNPSTYSTKNSNISNRSYASNSINWANVDAWNSIGQSDENQRSIDIAALLNQVISNPNWNAGNSIAFKIEGNGYRTAESFEGNGSGPVLTIQYDISNCGDLDNDGIIDACDTCPTINNNLIWMACNDGDPCTTGEFYHSNCDCIGGVSKDSDYDGICDGLDICPDFNDGLIGTTCDDGDPCTTGETYQSNCVCAGGVFTDTDNDDICDSLDICPGFNDGLIGATCEDGDVCTAGETYDNNCNCSGGTVIDTDNDSICDAEDVCANGDDTIDVDNDGIPDACDACLEFMVEANNRSITSSSTHTNIYIKSNGVVNTGNNVSYKSGEYIELKNNFEVKRGASFSVEIEDCE